jgi:hypothetical protein
MGGLLALAFRHRLMDGEALAAILWLPRGGRYATAIQVIDPDRLSNPYNAVDIFQLTTHPHVIGYRSRIWIVEELIRHAKSKGGCWFATHRDVAAYAKAHAA